MDSKTRTRSVEHALPVSSTVASPMTEISLRRESITQFVPGNAKKPLGVVRFGNNGSGVEGVPKNRNKIKC